MDLAKPQQLRPSKSSFSFIKDMLAIVNLALVAFVIFRWWNLGDPSIHPWKSSVMLPVLLEWKNYRNMLYLCYAGAFLIIGFSVLSSQKIHSTHKSPLQTAILPIIIQSVIVTTFSYAIAGILIDLFQMVLRVSGTLSAI